MPARAPGAAPVATRVVRAERARRRATLLAVLALLVMAIMPMTVDHLPIGLEQALADLDHLGALCMAALHVILAPVHGVFHVLLGAGLVYALHDRMRAWRRLVRALAPLDATVPRADSPIGRAATTAGLPLDAVRVVSGLPNPAFTVGLLSPRVYVAAELPYRLDPDQLLGVMRHEAAHVTRRDPLRFSLLRALACALFWMPALARLAEDLRDDSEIRADDSAAERGPALVLATAIVALAAWPAARPLPSGVAGFCHAPLLDRRVRRLLGEEVTVGTHLTRGSIGIAVLALGLAWSTGLLMAHPLPADATAGRVATHCEHNAESPLGHLFCRGTHSGDCPHGKTTGTAHRHDG